MKDSIIQLRISNDLKEEAKIKADKENRTLSNYIINLITQDLENRKEEKEMGKEIYFVLDEKFNNKEKSVLIQSWIKKCEHRERALKEAEIQWNHLTDSEKECRIITVGYGNPEYGDGDFSYDMVKEYIKEV